MAGLLSFGQMPARAGAKFAKERFKHMAGIVDLDLERYRRLDPDTVASDSQGREMTQFVASYDLGDSHRQMISFWAHSRHDAKVRLVMMRRSLRFEGVPADFDVADIDTR